MLSASLKLLNPVFKPVYDAFYKVFLIVRTLFLDYRRHLQNSHFWKAPGRSLTPSLHIAQLHDGLTN